MSARLPPLNALRAFESAVRHGSFVAAAAELGVTPAAVSQQVRKLEDWLGKELFRRGPNHITPTDAGEAVFRGATGALSSLSRMAEGLLAPARHRTLVVSSVASVSRLWLLPELVAFMDAHPGITVQLREEADPVDLAALDLRLSYGPVRYPGATARPLVADSARPVCSPAWLAARPEVAASCAALQDRDLIHTDWGPQFGSHPTWASWFALAGISRPAPTAGLGTNIAGIAVDMARAGLGVALGLKTLVQRDLAEGRLVALSTLSADTDERYTLILPRPSPAGSAVAALADWIVAAALRLDHAP